MSGIKKLNTFAFATKNGNAVAVVKKSADVMRLQLFTPSIVWGDLNQPKSFSRIFTCLFL